MRSRPLSSLAAVGAAAVMIGGAAGCGSSSSSSSSAPGGSSAAAEAKATAGGDIPDNQVFLTYHNNAGGYSLSYPEGWTRKIAGSAVKFTDKDNSINASVASGSAPTTASAAAQLSKQAKSDPTLKAGKPQQMTINGAPVIKVTYANLGPKDPVTGKRLEIITDRYQYSHAGKVATLDLATPTGVDNVDAYRMISQSFKWS